MYASLSAILIELGTIHSSLFCYDRTVSLTNDSRQLIPHERSGTVVIGTYLDAKISVVPILEVCTVMKGDLWRSHFCVYSRHYWNFYCGILHLTLSLLESNSLVTRILLGYNSMLSARYIVICSLSFLILSIVRNYTNILRTHCSQVAILRAFLDRWSSYCMPGAYACLLQLLHTKPLLDVIILN